MKNPCQEIAMPNCSSLINYNMDWSLSYQMVQNEKDTKKRSLLKTAIKATEPELDKTIERIIKDSDLDEQLEHIQRLTKKLESSVTAISNKIEQTVEFTKRQELQDKLDALPSGFTWGETNTRDYLKDKFSKYEQTINRINF